MIYYPNIDPVAFHIGPVAVHWYGIMYLVGFTLAYILLRYRGLKSGWKDEQISDLVFYAAIGVVLGGRIGYVLFYNLPFYFHNPLSIFKVWDGGMSFHGGFIGVILVMWWLSRRWGRALFEMTDFIAPVVPLGLAAGRLGNFINGELWGRVTTVPWGMVYPDAGPMPRHPSELYEFLLEGILLFTVLWLFSKKPKPRMAVSGLFLLGYGCIRFFCEFFRQPDPQLGFVAFGWMTMGQILSIPMIILGVILLIISYKVARVHYDN